MKRAILRRYGIAVASVLLFLIVRLLLTPSIGTTSPMLLLLPAVLVAAWYGGLGPGIFATIASALLGRLFFIEPFGQLLPIRDPPDMIVLALSLLMGGALSALCDTLQRHRRELTALVANSPDLIWRLDSELRFAYVNPAAEQSWGMPASVLLGKRPAEIGLPEEVANLWLQRCRKTLVRGQETEIEFSLASGEGLRHYHSRVVPEFDADGIVQSVLGITHDVTTQRHAESARTQADEALRDSEERFRVMANLVPSCIWTATADGMINYANQRWYDFSGLTPEQTAGLEWTRVLHPDDLERCVAAWKRAIEEGTDYEIEVRNRRVDGEYRWLLNRAVPVRDEAGRITGWFGSSTDITEQIRAREALEEADRRKDEFIALLAHELRSPMAPIRNYIQLLRDLPPSDPRFEKARLVIDRQVRHQARMLDDLLDVSRLTRRKIRLQRERLDLVRLVRDTAEDHRAELERASLTLTLETPERPVLVFADPTRLAQIITNLLQNAGKFTEPGGSVAVRLTHDADRAHVTIADTGVGIEPAMLARVWDVFAQADRSLHRNPGGLGLGLALVKGLTELHGGEVRAESEGPGRGTTFSFSLPLAAATAARPISSGSDETPALSLRVLVVEDNPDTLESLRDLLEFYGCRVAVAASGTEGLQTAQRFLPEVILCDLGLPGLDGFELATALRLVPELEKTLLVAVSGYGGEEIRRRARDAGFDAHLVKPIDFTELRRLLQGERGGRESL